MRRGQTPENWLNFFIFFIKKEHVAASIRWSAISAGKNRQDAPPFDLLNEPENMLGGLP